jgi:beta-1,4-mannosyl-glycoprotein beta-1,4-N-acetylglucosaminyltransferase
MRVIDCITYFNEPMLFELRLNILEKHIDEFLVCEARYTHAGKKKNLNFDINKFKNFKNKINYVIVENEPSNLENINNFDGKNNSLFRNNAQRRILHQRETIFQEVKKKNKNDWIIYSDSDEIPNLELFNLKECKKKIVLFNQKLFYYKFNLCLPDYNWFGSKACRVKDLNSITDLRNIKTKKYDWWRVDTLLKKNKFINLEIVNNGGWHFSMIKSPEEIFEKHKNDEHHDEFELTNIGLEDVQKMINDRYIHYDHKADKKDFKSKWGKDIKVQLSKINNEELPKYLLKNKNKYEKWFDNI